MPELHDYVFLLQINGVLRGYVMTFNFIGSMEEIMEKHEIAPISE